MKETKQQNNHNAEYVEAEVITPNKTKSRAGQAFGFAAKTGAGFAVDQAFERVDGVRKQMFLIALIWTMGTILGVIALISLIGWLLFAVLPSGIAGIILGVLVAPVVWVAYFVLSSIFRLSKRTKITRK